MSASAEVLIFVAMCMIFVLALAWLIMHGDSRERCLKCKFNCNNCEHRRRK